MAVFSELGLSFQQAMALGHLAADEPLPMSALAGALQCDNSNVTGIVTDTHAISDLLHRHGALSFWDYAAAAPYAEIQMYGRSTRHPLAYKDAVFCSPHKFVGGPGTLLGPVLGSVVLTPLSEATRALIRGRPGVDVMVYGALLVVVITFLPGGLAGAWRRARRLARAGQA